MNKGGSSQGNLQCPLPQDAPPVREVGHGTLNCLYEEAAAFSVVFPLLSMAM